MSLEVFDPVLYSLEENAFLLDHLGEPPIIARRNAAGTPVVNPAAVLPLIERVFELEQLKKEDGTEWVGIEAIKGQIKTYLREDAKWAADHARHRNAPRFPSLSSYDAKGRPHRGGIGSDSDRVRTYFGPAGERLPFAIDLVPSGVGEWHAPGFTEATTEKGLRVDQTTNRIECLVKVGEGVCGHTESYKADSRSSYNAARARMSKHLRKATENIDDHRETHTNEFGG